MQSAGLAAIVLAASGFAAVGLNSPVPVTIWILSPSDIAPRSSDVRVAGDCVASIHGHVAGIWCAVDACQARTGACL
jgi:hypothetical protein